jgi:hypothetical protein
VAFVAVKDKLRVEHVVGPAGVYNEMLKKVGHLARGVMEAVK